MKKYLYPLAALSLFSALFWSLPATQKTSETFQKLTLNSRDLFFKIRRFSSGPPAGIDDLLIVSIDEESCQRLKARWPWSRKVLAGMIRQLDKRGARVIGFNLSFTGLEGESDESTQDFAAAATAHGRVVVGATFDRESRLIPPQGAIAQAVASYGYLEKILDPDFTIRRSYLIRRYMPSESSEPLSFESSFPLQTVAAYRMLGMAGDAREPYLDLDRGLIISGSPNERVVSLDVAGIYPVNYLATETDFKTVPAWKVVEGKIPDHWVRGKAVLVGLTSSLFADRHRTPVGMMPGVMIHANEFLAIQSGRQLRFFPDWVPLSVSFLTALAIFGLFLARRFWAGSLAALSAATGLFMGAQAAFSNDMVLEPYFLIFGPCLAAAAGFLVYSAHLLWDNRGLERRMIRDKMTGLYTYDYLRIRVEAEWKAGKKIGHPVSIVMTDLDRFKKINDTLGHEAGNQMILRAAAVIRESARGYDVVARYGGDEFVVLLWRTNREEAENYRRRLRELYQRMAARLEPALKDSSICIGLATFDPAVNPAFPESPQRLIEEADRDLFDDKEKRREG